jgi:hypothetical protein
MRFDAGSAESFRSGRNYSAVFRHRVLTVRRAHGELSHATRDPRRVREYFLDALPRTSFRAPAALIIVGNAGLPSPCASLPANARDDSK